jgi:branched-chain amino acid transport system ATP-binding protein
MAGAEASLTGPTTSPPGGGASLEVQGLVSGYRGLEVLHGVDLRVPAGKLTSLVGPNGAGKTTLLRTISALLGTTSGKCVLDGKLLITGKRPESVVDLGISLVPEGRHVFPQMSVRDNLLLGAYLPRARARTSETLKDVEELFPTLREKGHLLARSLSGGEAQMLAIGRALMSRPRLLMVDEPSLGLAPQVVSRVFQTLLTLRQRGVSVFVVEQNVRQILRISDEGYVLSQGRVIDHAPGKELLEHPEVRRAFLGV